MGQKTKIVVFLCFVLTGCASREWNIFQRTQENIAPDPNVLKEPKRLTAGFESNFALSISPSEDIAFYASNRLGNFDIWAKKLTGGTPKQVTFHSADDFSPSISPDGDYLAFISRREDATGDLHIMDLGLQFKNYLSKSEGKSEPVSLPLTIEQNPCWFPDSERILFESNESSSSEPPLFMIVDVDSKIPKPFHNLRGRNPKISKDGKYLTYMRANGIYIFNIEKEKEYQLTKGDVYLDGQPSFHDENKGIYFIRFADDTDKNRVINGDDLPTIWYMQLKISDAKIEALTPKPIMSSRYSGFYPEHFSKNVFFTMLNANTLDVFSLPDPGQMSDDGEKINLSQLNELDRIFVYRTKGVNALEQNKKPDALSHFKMEQFLHGKLGHFLEAEKLEKFIRSSDLAKEEDKDYFQLLTIEAKYGSHLFPSATEDSSKSILTPKEQKFVLSLKAKYGKSADLLKVTETFLARHVATTDDPNKALQHIDSIIQQEGLSNDSQAEALSLKTKILCKAFEFDSALYATKELEEKYPEQELVLNETADYLIKSILNHYKSTELSEKLGSLRVSTEWPETIKARAHIAQAEFLLKEGKSALAANELKVIASDYKHSDGALSKIAPMIQRDGSDITADNKTFIYEKLNEQLAKNPRYSKESAKQYAEFIMSRAGKFQNMGEIALAIKEYKKVLKVDERYLPAHRGLILGYYQKKLLSTELKDHEKNRDSKDPFWKYLYIYAETFKIDQAAGSSEKLDIIDDCIEDLEEVVNLDPTVTEYHLTLGWLYYQRHLWSVEFRKSGTFSSKFSNSWKITKNFFGFSEKDWLKESIDSYLSALYLAQSDPVSQSNIEQNLAEAYFELENYPEALRYYLHRLNKLKNFPVSSKFIEGNLYYKAATSAYQSDKLDLAAALQKQGLKIFEALDNKNQIGLGLDRLAFYFDRSGDYPKAIDAYHEILKLPENKKDPFNKMIALGNLSRAQIRNNQFASAIESVGQHIEILESLSEDHPGFKNSKTSAIQINLGDKQSGGGRLDKNMRLLFAHTLHRKASQGLGDFLSARDSLMKKKNLLVAMREGKVNLFSDKTYLAENISIAYNNLGVLEQKLGLCAQATESFHQASLFANINDPGKEKLNKPSQINLKNALTTALSSVSSSREPLPKEIVSGLEKNIQQSLKDNKLDVDKEYFTGGVQFIADKTPEFINRKDPKEFKKARREYLKKDLDRTAYFLEFGHYQRILDTFKKQNFADRPLSFTDRLLLRKTAFRQCQSDQNLCGSALKTLQNLVDSSRKRLSYKDEAYPDSEDAAVLYLAEEGGQTAYLVANSEGERSGVVSNTKIHTALDKAALDLEVNRLYIASNSSSVYLLDSLLQMKSPVSFVGSPSEVSVFEKSTKMMATAASIIGSMSCSPFTKAGILCSQSDNKSDLKNPEQSNFLIVSGQARIHSLTDAIHNSTGSTTLKISDSLELNKQLLRTVIYNVDIQNETPVWKDFFLSDFVANISGDAASHGVHSALLTSKPLNEGTLTDFIVKDMQTPQSQIINQLKIKGFLIGHPGRLIEEKKELAADLMDIYLDLSDELVDSGKKKEAALAKRQVLFFADLTGDASVRVDMLEELVLLEYELRNYDSALFFQKRRLSEMNKDDEDYEDILMNAAILAVRSQNDQDALKFLKESESIYLETGDNETLGKVHFYMGLHSEQMRRYSDAVAQYSSARKDYQKADALMEASEQLLHIANLYKERTNEFSKALTNYKTATREFEELDEAELAYRASLDYANTYITMGQTQQAIDILEGLLEDEDDANVQDSLRARQFLANAYYRSGQYQMSNNSLQIIFQQISQNPNAEFRAVTELNATNLQAMVTAKLGDVESGLKILRNGLFKADEFSLEAHKATRFNNIGYLLREQGDYTGSIVEFRKAMVIDRKLKSKENIAFDQRNIGLSYVLMKRYDDAIQQLQAALDASRELGLNYNMAYCLFGLGDLERERGDYQKSNNYYQEALTISEKSFLRDFTWKAHAGLAENYRSLNQAQKATASFQAALKIIENLRAGLSSKSAKTGFQSDAGVQSVYESYVEHLMAQKDVRNAWEVSEKARARAFIDSMGIQRLKIGKPEIQDLVKSREKLQEDIEYLQVAYGETKEEAKRAEVELELSNRSSELKRIESELNEKAPEVSQFQSVNTLKLEDVQSRLGEKQAIVEYFLGPTQIQIWVIQKDKFSGVSMPVTKGKMEELTTEFHTLLMNYASLRFNISELSRYLVRPIQQSIAGLSSLIIVPHSFLHHLPFSALAFREDVSDSLLDTYSLSFLESASMLRFIKLDSKINDETVLVFGNPDRGEKLNLPFASKEARSIKRYYPNSKVFTEEEASLTNFVKFAPDASMIHLASHGQFDKINPMDSRLLLSAAKNQSGDLAVKDLFNLNLSASLVTLSACETGLGKVTSGDEVIGLNRAFFYAGVDSLVSSLWRISDVASAITMKRFYRYMAEGHTRSESLRMAQLLVRDFFDHPAYWAPFKLTGAY